MPDYRKYGPGAAGVRAALALAAASWVSGCVGPGAADLASRAFMPQATVAAGSPNAPAELDGKGAVHSGVITDLTSRASVLPKGGDFDKVARSVLAAGSGASEAELRVARLTAKAKSKNWLPSIGPDVSLTSLGSLAASILLDQALFDNGRRKAERSFAAADVEVAAVTLATDLNQRVYEGLKLYVEARRAAELAAITSASLEQMRDFDRIMKIRLDGGLSDRSEYRIIEQKLAEMVATHSQEVEAEKTAWAELDAMSMGDLHGLTALSALPPDPGAPEPLAVLMARAEASRTAAEVQIARSGLMPGFGAKAALDKGGGVNAGLSLDGEGLGFGRKDSLKALEEAEVAAGRRVDETAEAASRRIVALQREIESLTTQERQEAVLLEQMAGNLDLFKDQYKAGRASLIEFVGQFESFVRMRRDHASLKYAIAMARLEIARERGVLIDGAAM